MTVKILSLTPIGHYADGAPQYSFSTSYPTRGVRMAGRVRPTMLDAYDEGLALVRDYQSIDRFGNMGEVCGVAEVEGGFCAVINTYHSNT